MKKWMMLLAMIMLAAGTAMADISNEVVVGIEVDSVDSAKDSAGADITDKIENDNSLFVVQYTHFISPLKDDGKPIELRRFYQHPSTLSAGLAFIGSTEKDKTVPSDGKTNVSLLLLGGEYFFPTDTGLFLNIGIGSGTFEETSGGVVQPDVDIEHSEIEFGVRQYVVPEVELHLRFTGESTEVKQAGFTSTTDKNITYLGIHGIIKDVVGLGFEIGGGELEETSGGLTITSDVAAVNLEGAVYVGKDLSFSLTIEAEVEEMNGAPAGIKHTISTGRTTLAARYWFSEGFGMELPIYAETEERKTEVSGVGTFKSETTNAGLGLYAAFRF